MKQRFLVQFGSTMLVQIVGMIAGIVVARIAGPSVVGKVAYGAAYVGILGFIHSLFGSAHIKLLAGGKNSADCISVYSRLQGAAAMVYLLAMGGWFLFQKHILHYPFESREVEIIIIISLFTHFFTIYESYSSVAFTARLMQAKANVPHVLNRLLWHVGRIVIVALGLKAISLSAWGLVLAIVFIPVIFNLQRSLPRGIYDRHLAGEYFRLALPIFIGAIIASVTSSGDKLLLAHFTSTTELGYYSAAHGIGGMFLLIAAPVGNIFFPLFASMISKGKWEGVNTNIRKYQEFIILFVLPAMCAVAICGGPALLLALGKRYEPSVLPFMILIFSTYIVLMGLPYGNILAGLGKFGLIAWIDVIRFGLFALCLPVFLSPKLLGLGAIGLALNQFTLNLARNGLYLHFARKFGEVRLDRRNALRQLMIVSYSLLAFWLSLHARKFFDLWWLVYLPLYVTSMYLLLIKTGMIKNEHWSMLMEAVNVKKTIKYATDELKNIGE